MRLTPAYGHDSAIWWHQQPQLSALGVWTEKRPGRGEDAEPLLLHNYAAETGMLAVSDGVGGAGVQVAGRTSDGEERTGAWVSSRGVRLAAEDYFHRTVLSLTHPGDAARAAARHGGAGPSLHHGVNDILQRLRSPARSRIAGTMQRELPTTLAALMYKATRGGLSIRIRWAGDSRCYMLTPSAGLQQLSRDDSEAADALEALEQDPPMTNQIAADGRYQIHDEPAEAQLPVVLICATDGFFNYVTTPAHFEYILLRAMADSNDTRTWADALAKRVQEYTQDDASLALAAFGYNDFGQLHHQFRDRLVHLESEHWQPFQKLAKNDEAIRDARQDSWARYRDSYERKICRPEETAK